MRVFFVNRFFHPDHSATSQIASDLAFELAARGLQVVAITSRQRYDDAAAALPRAEVVHGVHIVRLRAPVFGRTNLAGRALDYLGFYFGAMWSVLCGVRRGDVVVAMTDPPLLGVVLWPVAALRGARLVHWLQDLFPEIAERLGVRAIRPLAPLLRVMRNAVLRRGQATVVIGAAMGRLVERECGRAPTLIPNWALEEATDSVAKTSTARLDHSLRREWDLGDAFIVGYSGNMGRAHALDGLIEAATLLKGEPGIAFLLIGDGAQCARLAQTARARGLPNLQFRPYQARSMLHTSLTLPDIHVVSLDARLEGLMVPSKFVGAIALGKPVLWLGAEGGEVGALLRSSQAGIVAPPENAAALAAAIRALAHDPARLQSMAAQAHALWQRQFRRADALAQWQRLLAGIMHE